MGRKSSAKAQTRPASSTPPAEPPRPFSPLIVAGILAVVAIVGLFAYARTGRPADGIPKATQTDANPQAQTAPPDSAKFGPHRQETLPPLPFNPSPPARPMDVVNASYRFAAEHPEVLAYVPCYCGCERSGHRGNDDCFVAARAANGDVTEWEPHGMT